MKLTYIGMNNGGIKEAHRLQPALRDTRDIIEDCYAVGNFAGAKALLVTEAEELASLEMVMRCDATHVHPSRPVSPRLPSGAYLIEQGDDFATFGGVLM